MDPADSTIVKAGVVFEKWYEGFITPDEIPFASMPEIKFIGLGNGRDGCRMDGSYVFYKDFGETSVSACYQFSYVNPHKDEFDGQEDILENVRNSFMDHTWKYKYEDYSCGEYCPWSFNSKKDKELIIKWSSDEQDAVQDKSEDVTIGETKAFRSIWYSDDDQGEEEPVFTVFMISFDGEETDIQKVLPVVEERLEISVDGTPEELDFSMEETFSWLGFEFMTDTLALSMAKASPALTFIIEGEAGVINLGGQCMNFSISYTDGIITERKSNWFCEIDINDYENYEEFSNEFCDQNGDPLYSEEEFETFKEIGWLYVLKGETNTIVEEVPFDCIRIVNIQQ